MIDITRKHNNPPEQIDLAQEVTRDLSQWLSEHPAASTEEEAREVKKQIDRAKLCLKDLGDERDGKVRPLNEQVDAINHRYRVVRKPLGAVLDQMLAVLEGYVQREEQNRIAAALEAERIAREAEQKARELDRIEQEKRDDALQGEVGIDIAEITEQADAAFEEYTKAQRAAIRAQAETRVKVGGGFSRAIGLRQAETLYVDDPIAAIQDMGGSILVDNDNKLRTALLTAAKAFRKLNGRLPTGIRAEISRAISGKKND